MPLLVLDTSVSLPATLSEPGGLARKLMVVLAYGALTYRIEHLRLEFDALQTEQNASGGELAGAQSIEALISAAADRHSALSELLPHGTPDDWIAVGSPSIFDEYLRKLLEVGRKLRPSFDTSEAPEMLARLQAICAVGAPAFDVSATPAFTADPMDDPIVYSALLADADLLVSDDKHIIPVAERPTKVYTHGELSVTAMTFDQLMHDHLSTIEWDEIDGAWLLTALG